MDVLFTPYFTLAHASHVMQPRIDTGDVESSPLELGMPGLGPYKYGGFEKGGIGKVRKNEGY